VRAALPTIIERELTDRFDSAPMAGILTCDYWIIRGCKLDVPSLYNPHGRYRYTGGFNWRAVVVMLVIIVPMLPGLGYAVSPETVNVPTGLIHLYDISWLYGYHASMFLYWLFNVISPAGETLIAKTIPGIPEVVEGVDAGSVESKQEVIEVKPGSKASGVDV
jgi:nucleobase:cation symporter-1, NCS1 family